MSIHQHVLDYLDQLKQYITALSPIFLAVCGGMVRKVYDGECSWKGLIAGAIVGGFVGLLVYLGLQGVEWHPKMEAGLIGASSFLGGDLIKVAFNRACTVIIGTATKK